MFDSATQLLQSPRVEHLQPETSRPRTPKADSSDRMESTLARRATLCFSAAKAIQSGRFSRSMLCVRSCNDTQCWGQEHNPPFTRFACGKHEKSAGVRHS